MRVDRNQVIFRCQNAAAKSWLNLAENLIQRRNSRRPNSRRDPSKKLAADNFSWRFLAGAGFPAANSLPESRRESRRDPAGIPARSQWLFKLKILQGTGLNFFLESFFIKWYIYLLLISLLCESLTVKLAIHFRQSSVTI